MQQDDRHLKRAHGGAAVPGDAGAEVSGVLRLTVLLFFRMDAGAH